MAPKIGETEYRSSEIGLRRVQREKGTSGCLRTGRPNQLRRATGASPNRFGGEMIVSFVQTPSVCDPRGIHLLNVIEQGHKPEVHVQLLVAVKQSEPWICVDKIDLDFLVPAHHHNIF